MQQVAAGATRHQLPRRPVTQQWTVQRGVGEANPTGAGQKEAGQTVQVVGVAVKSMMKIVHQSQGQIY